MLRWLRPAVLATLAIGIPTLTVMLGASSERPAHASAVIALTLDDLVDKSDVVVVVTPKSKSARWESGRIITYTTVVVDTAVAGGPAAGDSLTVRTMGGVVGDIGQKVFGEASLPIGAPVVLFLRDLPKPLAATSMPGARSVTGMAQGVMPIVLGADKVQRVGPSATSLTLVPPPNPKSVPANVATSGRPVKDVVVELRTLWTSHGKK
jgi:hypothetical protein